MAKSGRGRRRLLSRQFSSTPYRILSHDWKAEEKEDVPKKTTLAVEKNDWEDATCSVCMEFPHNAVLLLCSSHDKGCRPYMCGTSHRHSNCLDQFKKAYTKETNSDENQSLRLTMPGWPVSDKSELLELACPLCRGKVKGWTVVGPAREYLDSKRRSCLQEDCSFMGSYRELRKHVRSEHPSANPHDVDPALEQKWRTLESEIERQDVFSTVRSMMPGSVVLGDYVIDMNHSDFEDVEAGEGEFEGEGRGVGRNILYFFLREGARLMRFQRDSVDLEGGEEDDGYVPSMSGGSTADSSVAYPSEGDDMPRSHRRRRRRSGS